MREEPAGRDLRLVPVAAAMWAMAWAVTGGATIPWWGIALLLAACAAAAASGRPVVAAVCVVAAGTALIAGARQGHLSGGLPADLGNDGAYVEVEAVLRGDLMVYPGRGARPPAGVVTLDVRSVSGHGSAARVSVPAKGFLSGEALAAFGEIHPGSAVRLNALARAAEPGDGVGFVLRIAEAPRVLSAPGLADRAVNRYRAALRDALAASPAEQAALVPSLVVGDTSAITGEMSERFRATALTHLLAVSGANLTLLLGFVLGVARWCGVRGWWVRAIAVVAVAAFVAVCRAEPSVLRAAAMGLVGLAALGTGRGRQKGTQYLCVAVLVLLAIDPWLSRSWGFALSVSASAGILCWAPGWQDAMRAWAPPWLAEAICVPLAAQLATQPLVTALSGQVSVVGLVANALVGPFVGPGTVLGLIAGGLCLLWAPLGTMAGWLAGWVVQPILWVASVGAGLPAAAWPVRTDAVTLVLLGFGCLAVGAAAKAVLARRCAAGLLVAGLLIASGQAPPVLGWPGTWGVVFCDVGQGDTTVLRAGPGQAVLVDTGPEPDSALDCLRSLGIRRVPLLILTHYHADHVGGLGRVLEEFPVGQILVSRLASPVAAAREVSASAKRAGVQVKAATPGERYQVGEVSLTMVWAGEAAPEHGADADQVESVVQNDASIIAVVEVAGLRLLLPGDAELDGQRAGLRSAEALQISLKAHILKLPHHGAARQEPDFFSATGATLAVASAGRHNDYGHPSPRALSLAARFGMQVRRPDPAGSVAVARAENGRAVRARGP
ncbi:MAG: ComEC/Rec2 family competence protein [Propionibacteriaceae bacterium]|nr:ComEC/Rec2 family competence protein [Propionibacteriaceae bacterium]